MPIQKEIHMLEEERKLLFLEISVSYRKLAKHRDAMTVQLVLKKSRVTLKKSSRSLKKLRVSLRNSSIKELAKHNTSCLRLNEPNDVQRYVKAILGASNIKFEVERAGKSLTSNYCKTADKVIEFFVHAKFIKNVEMKDMCSRKTEVLN